MKLFILEHHHRHGTSVFLLQSERVLTAEDAAEYLGSDYEPNRDDEWLEITQSEPTTIL